jgi:hypothetical protein
VRTIHVKNPATFFGAWMRDLKKSRNAVCRLMDDPDVLLKNAAGDVKILSAFPPVETDDP